MIINRSRNRRWHHFISSVRANRAKRVNRARMFWRLAVDRSNQPLAQHSLLPRGSCWAKCSSAGNSEICKSHALPPRLRRPWFNSSIHPSTFLSVSLSNPTLAICCIGFVVSDLLFLKCCLPFGASFAGKSMSSAKMYTFVYWSDETAAVNTLL